MDSGARMWSELLVEQGSAYFSLSDQWDTADTQPSSVSSMDGSTYIRRPLASGEVLLLDSVDSVCRALADWGADNLAKRLAYLASDEDQEEDEIPATLESARAFLEFFSQVKTSAILNLTCSPEGWICAEWDYEDGRSVGLWFIDFDSLMFVAADSNGNFVDIDGDNEIGQRRTITRKLVQAGFFEWVQKHILSAISLQVTTSPDTVGLNPSASPTASLRETLSFSEESMAILRNTFRRTGWSTFTIQNDPLNSTASDNRYPENSLFRRTGN